MEELTLAVPGMWADHHVLAVRDLLREDDAVASTAASALERAVRIEYDASRTDPQRLTALLAAGGYACGEPEQAAGPRPTNPPGPRQGSASPPPTPSTWPCRETTASTDAVPPPPPVPSVSTHALALRDARRPRPRTCPSRARDGLKEMTNG